MGPLTVKPEYWDSGIAQKLLESTLTLFERWGITHAGLFTFPESTKHITLYHKFGFHARFLTPVMVKGIAGKEVIDIQKQFTKLSRLDAKVREQALLDCKKLTNSIYDGLN